jgi:regulator of protease activity HflC (stomatin/prohibitin superfamily)
MAASRPFRPSMETVGTGRTLGTLAVIFAIIVLIVGALTSGFAVQAGNVGVVTTFGRVEPGVLEPGFHLRVPFVTIIHQIDVRVQPHSFQEIDAASLEQQSVKLTGTMNYHLDPQRANELFQTVGLDFASKVIDPAFSDYIKEVVPKYRASDMLQKRDEIRRTTRDKLTENLSRYGIIVDDIYISNIAFSPEYQQAIEQKQTAQQNVGREEQLLAQKEIQARQRVVEAKGLADAAVETARGEAEANRVRADSLSPQLVQYLQTQKWDGKLPLVTSGAIPLIDLGVSTGQAPVAQPAPAAQPAPQPTARPTPTAAPTAAPTPTAR